MALWRYFDPLSPSPGLNNARHIRGRLSQHIKYAHELTTETITLTTDYPSLHHDGLCDDTHRPLLVGTLDRMRDRVAYCRRSGVPKVAVAHARFRSIPCMPSHDFASTIHDASKGVLFVVLICEWDKPHSNKKMLDCKT